MDREPKPGAIDAEGSQGVAGPRLTRRVVLAGMGSALFVDGARAIDSEDLQLFFADDQHDEVVISYAGTERRWNRKLFGESASYRLLRESSVVEPDQQPRTWVTSTWTLIVQSASFPGREDGPHRLTFRFSRDPVKGGALGPWHVLLETAQWPAKVDTARRFGSRTGPEVARLGLRSFLMDAGGGMPPCLEADLPAGIAQSTLAGFFGLRIQADGPIVLGLDHTLAWRVTGKLFILNFSLRFATLTIERIFGTDERSTAPLANVAPPEGTATAASPTPASVPESRRRLFADEAPRQRAGAKGRVQASPPVGLYAEAGAPFMLPSRFELAFAGEGPGRVGATLAIDEPLTPESLRAGLRHWGRPEETVSGLILERGGECGDLRTLARLEVTSGDPKAPSGPASVFQLSSVAITRQQRPTDVTEPAARVETWVRLTPSAKEHAVATPFGPMDVRAAPPVQPRTGLPARVPPIVIRAVDIDPKKEVRRIESFEATLSMVSAGVRLPERAAGPDAAATERLGEHVTRLDFADAECRFVLPALGAPVAPVAADAVVPLGPDLGPRPREAHLDLGRAKLTVLRPTDLLSLSYRFSGLLLEIPRRAPSGPRRPSRVLPSRGGPVCRAESGLGARESASHPARDERPVLAVEFPPQHVAERAYFRQVPTIELPLLPDGLTSAEDVMDLAKLREPKPRRGADPAGTHRKQRQAARERLDRRVTALLTAIVQAPSTGRDQEKEKENARLHLELRRIFNMRTSEAKLPKEQRVYLGPDFLDPDARRIARAILAEQGAPGRPSAPDVDLSVSIRVATLAALNDPAIGPGATIDPMKPEYKRASDALELTKEGA